jgi:hypothetical protein
MTTRAECDGFYRALGLPGFSAEYPASEVLALAQRVPESLALQVRRCVALAETDVDEYFDISEHATRPDAVAAILRPTARQRPLFLLHPWDNRQHPFALHVIAPGGYCERKYTGLRYARTPMSLAALRAELNGTLTAGVSNLPPDTVCAIMDGSGGDVLHPLDLTREPPEFYDVLPTAESGLPRFINCLTGWVLWGESGEKL